MNDNPATNYYFWLEITITNDSLLVVNRFLQRNHSFCRGCSLQNIFRHSLWNWPPENIVCLNSIKLGEEAVNFFNIVCFLKQKSNI